MVPRTQRRRRQDVDARRRRLRLAGRGQIGHDQMGCLMPSKPEYINKIIWPVHGRQAGCPQTLSRAIGLPC